MRSKKQVTRPKRTKVPRNLWLQPNVDAALREAANSGHRDINRQATIYIIAGLERDGLLVAESTEAAR